MIYQCNERLHYIKHMRGSKGVKKYSFWFLLYNQIRDPPLIKHFKLNIGRILIIFSNHIEINESENWYKIELHECIPILLNMLFLTSFNIVSPRVAGVPKVKPGTFGSTVFISVVRIAIVRPALGVISFQSDSEISIN